MARILASRQTDGNAFVRFFDHIDRALMPIFGPPPVTQSNPELGAAERGEMACPICGEAIKFHEFDSDAGNIVVLCPTDERLPMRHPTGPLNELGMPER
ncbi:MAG TPA: hypothetical protein VFU07_06055 [Candidatus Lumbricidophila sp.]|nr:hypothetical protein [Candidatus Lumbricidophila sp.]